MTFAIDLPLTALCVLCILLGIAIGASITSVRTSRRARRYDAPAPVDIGFDPSNPINRRHRDVAVGETDEYGFVRIS